MTSPTESEPFVLRNGTYEEMLTQAMGRISELEEQLQARESVAHYLWEAEQKILRLQEQLARCVDVQEANQETYWNQTEYERKKNSELEEQFRTLQAAAMRLCNVHRWSYGGPETLIALADRIAENPAKSPSS